MDIDFSCAIDDCTKMAAASRPYCSAHNRSIHKYGTATPTVTCFGCNETYSYTPQSTLYGSHHHLCQKCSELTKTYNHLVPNGAYNHGINRIDYIKMLVTQGFKCKICKKDRDKLNVDHDHSCCPKSTGCKKCIRGLLCRSCNTFLGFLEQYRDELDSFNEYLSAPRIFA